MISRNFERLIASLLPLAMLACGMLLSSTNALAADGHFLITSFGSGSGPFQTVQSIATDAAGDIYVLDEHNSEGAIYKFSASGQPLDFTGLQSNAIIGLAAPNTFEDGAEEVAIDNAPNSPNRGDLYVANNREVRVYDSTTGLRLDEEEPLNVGEMCGVAVGATGEVYVGVYPSTVRRYKLKSSPIDSNPIQSLEYNGALWGLNEVCNVAVDADGNVYAAGFLGGVSKYASSQINETETPAVSSPEGSQIDPVGKTLAVDPRTDDVYVDEQSDITRYSPTGAALGVSGVGLVSGVELSPKPSYGVAIDSSTGTPASGELYAADSSGEVDIFSHLATLPDVLTGSVAGDVTASSATLPGTVDPLDLNGASYNFEYGGEEAEGKVIYRFSTPDVAISGEADVSVSASVGDLAPDTTYHYRLDTTDDTGFVNTGADEIFTTALAPPTIGSEPTAPINISEAGAVLVGVINPGENSSARYHFVYGTSASYGSQTPDLVAPPAARDETLTEAVGGLLPGTIYHYALVASNKYGSATGPDQTLTTTAPSIPSVNTNLPEEIGQTGATLAAGINTLGIAVSARGFDLGVDTKYTTVVDLGEIPSGSPGSQAMSVRIGSLQPGTTYHFRAFVTSATGTTFGADRTFTTLGLAASSGAGILAVPAAVPLLPIVAFVTEKVKISSKPPSVLTNAQKLVKALKVCRVKARGKRRACERQVRKKYAKRRVNG